MQIFLCIMHLKHTVHLKVNYNVHLHSLTMKCSVLIILPVFSSTKIGGRSGSEVSMEPSISLYSSSDDSSSSLVLTENKSLPATHRRKMSD